MPDAGVPAEKKDLSRLKGTLKMAFSRKAPWWMKILRCSVLVLSIYPTVEFGVLPNLPGRPLTTEETIELRHIFKDSIDYSKERIHSSKTMDLMVNPIASLTGTLIYGHTRGNVMIVNGEINSPNFADKENLYDMGREVFIHENVHVWQHQNAPLSMAWATMKQSLKRQGGIDGFYTYHLSPGKDLLDYNVEQQAVIITDYYLRVAKGETPENCANTETGPALKALYEGTLAQFRQNPSYIKNNGHKLR